MSLSAAVRAQWHEASRATDRASSSITATTGAPYMQSKLEGIDAPCCMCSMLTSSRQVSLLMEAIPRMKNNQLKQLLARRIAQE